MAGRAGSGQGGISNVGAGGAAVGKCGKVHAARHTLAASRPAHLLLSSLCLGAPRLPPPGPTRQCRPGHGPEE
eukprot:3423879-Alexandrium_andersonii.AAC.1